MRGQGHVEVAKHRFARSRIGGVQQCQVAPCTAEQNDDSADKYESDYPRENVRAREMAVNGRSNGCKRLFDYNCASMESRRVVKELWIVFRPKDTRLCIRIELAQHFAFRRIGTRSAYSIDIARREVKHLRIFER